LSQYRYRAIETNPEKGGYVSYGLLAEQFQNGNWIPITFIPDVSCSKAFVFHLAKLCTAGQLDPIQLPDVIMDALP